MRDHAQIQREVAAEALALVQKGEKPEVALGSAWTRAMAREALAEIWERWQPQGWVRRGEEVEFARWGVEVIRRRLEAMNEANPGGLGMREEDMVLAIECAMGEWVRGRQRGEASARSDR